MSMNYYSLAEDQTYTIRGSTKLLNIASAKYSGDWHCDYHTHEYMEIFYIFGGTGMFLIEDREQPVKVNDLVIINPDVPHAEANIRSQSLEYIVLGIEGIRLSAGKHSNGRYCILDHYESTEISGCLWNILREMEQKNTGFQDVCRACMEMLVIRLMRTTELTVSAEPQLTNGEQPCTAVKRYIDLHFKEPLSLEQLAGKVHMNKYYLAHTFKQEYGVSPISYMITRRIVESKYLLAETDLSLTQIAQLLGFSSPSYFSQAFRKSQGVSPMDYRKHARGL
ncbi:MAG: AraC family transcriptional regulator [Oscillospiraceae bacterium]|nr:AraC family transcriptional regulator [Oscillospiraceae bacterium]MBQ7130818.1 AraC family transcriptional regulator [Oscillospiraceae bacterium]